MLYPIELRVLLFNVCCRLSDNLLEKSTENGSAGNPKRRYGFRL